MITVKARIGSGPFSGGDTYLADVRADGSYGIRVNKRVVEMPEQQFKKYFDVVGTDRTPSGHRSYGTAQVESRAREVVSSLIEGYPAITAPHYQAGFAADQAGEPNTSPAGLSDEEAQEWHTGWEASKMEREFDAQSRAEDAAETSLHSDGFDARAPFPHASDPHWSSPDADFARW